jgi:mRNA-degrading endonuclease RelE of RelBE toxin-antitoxin system
MLTMMKTNAANDHKGNNAKNNDSITSTFVHIEEGRKNRQDKIRLKVGHFRLIGDSDQFFVDIYVHIHKDVDSMIIWS